MCSLYYSEYPFLNPQTTLFCKEIDIENKINVNVPKRPNHDSAVDSLNYDATEFVPKKGTPSSVQVEATFIDGNLQPTKRLKTEEIQSEIVIDEDEFL